MNQFPFDDELSICQGDNSDVNLEIYYMSLYHENEAVKLNLEGETTSTYFPLANKPVVNNSITVRVFKDEQSIGICLRPIGEFDHEIVIYDGNIEGYKIEKAHVDYNKGLIQLTWDKNPGDTHLLVSYETPRD